CAAAKPCLRAARTAATTAPLNRSTLSVITQLHPQSGTTALLVARERPRVPIIALTPLQDTARRLALSWGCNCVITESVDRFKGAVVAAVLAARKHGFAAAQDQVVVTAGVPFNVTGTTNILRVAPCDERLIYSTDPE
ncbi:MAG: pyruvate kinase alpha/beta domain-containing protein, partial [Pseudomonadota bacterium]